MPRLHLETLIDAPANTVFDLTRDIDAHLQSAGSSRERVIGGKPHGMMSLYDEVRWRATHFGIPLSMTVRITSFNRPHAFEDAMTDGPFAAMRHVHRFEPASGGTRMIDDFEFELPFGPVGALVARAIVAPYLSRFLRHRASVLKQLAEKRAQRA